MLLATATTETTTAAVPLGGTSPVNGALWGVLGLLVLLVGTYLGLRWLSRRNASSSSGRSEVLERIPLSRDAHVAIVRVGSRLMAVGISKEGVRYLCDVNPEDFGQTQNTASPHTRQEETVDKAQGTSKSTAAPAQSSFGRRFIHNLGVLSGFAKPEAKPLVPPSASGSADFAQLLHDSQAEIITAASEHPSPSFESDGVSGQRYADERENIDDELLELLNQSSLPDERPSATTPTTVAAPVSQSAQAPSLAAPPSQSEPPPPVPPDPATVHRRTFDYHAAFNELMQYNNPDRPTPPPSTAVEAAPPMESAMRPQSAPKPDRLPISEPEREESPASKVQPEQNASITPEEQFEPEASTLPNEAQPEREEPHVPEMLSEREMLPRKPDRREPASFSGNVPARKTPPPVPRGRKKTVTPSQEIPEGTSLLDMMDKSLVWEDPAPSQGTVMAALDAIDNAAQQEKPSPQPNRMPPPQTPPPVNPAPPPPSVLPPAAAAAPKPPLSPSDQTPSITRSAPAENTASQPANTRASQIARGYGSGTASSKLPPSAATGVEYIPSGLAPNVGRAEEYTPTKTSQVSEAAQGGAGVTQAMSENQENDEKLDQLFDRISKRGERYSARGRDKESR